MKKSNTITSFLLLVQFNLFAQLGINSDNSAPHPSAQLDVKSNNKGLLLPRVTAPASAIPSPAAGLMVYDQANANLAYYNGAQWSNLSGTAGNQGLYARFPNSLGFRGETYIAAPSYTEYTWIVPVGTTKIWVEAWAAGDAGYTITETSQNGNSSVGYKGGDAGDFGSFLMVVIPGELITIRVGKGGSSISSAGGNTLVFNQIAPIKNYTIGQHLTNITYQLNGVSTNQIPDLIQFVAGENGIWTKTEFAQSGATEFRRVFSGGKGGDSYPGQKGSDGLSVSFDVATGNHLMGGLISVSSRHAPSPGAGGGVNFGNTNNGGAGMVILHW